MYYFGAVESQLRRLARCYGGQESGRWYFAGIGGDDAVDFFPYLELFCFESDADQGGAEVGIASAYFLKVEGCGC